MIVFLTDFGQSEYIGVDEFGNVNDNLHLTSGERVKIS